MEALIHHFKFYSTGFALAEGTIYSSVEAPKGEFGVLVVSDKTNKAYRCHIRTPGFSHINGLNFMITNQKLADVVTILGTLDIVFGEVDR
jgi:NADH-quinone oxidoreductase subunit D